MAIRNRDDNARGLRRRAAPTALLALALGAGAATLSGLASAANGDARNCVDLLRIDRTDVVDDGTILFRMRNGDIYRNDLRHECPTLKDREQFRYRVTTTQLCKADIITVPLDRSVVLSPGPSCVLGDFQPIGESAAQSLLHDAAPSD
jgi:hypothetical protein